MHSVGVSKLAEQYSAARDINEHDSRILIAAGLLHDVGHGPLSHTLESIFDQEFGVNHHSMTQDILFGAPKFGSEILDIFNKYSVDLEETVAMINGKHDGEHSFLFSSQINLDTLEGITRCKAFAVPHTAIKSASQIIERLSFGTETTTSDFDDFWVLKHEIYEHVINGNIGLILDAVAQAYMRQSIDQFSASDFTLTETTLRKKHPSLFKLFDLIRQSPAYINPELSDNFSQVELFDQAKRKDACIKSIIPKNLFANTVQMRKRDFYIEKDIPLTSDQEINKRYRQTKEVSEVSLEEIIS